MIYVLVHSPVVGTFTWARVAEELRRRGMGVVVPALQSSPGDPRPYWEQHARAVAEAIARATARATARAIQALEPVSATQVLVLVAHSGAGPLLPAVSRAISQTTNHRVGGYLFVDAGLPQDGKSRLDGFEDQQAVHQFRQNAVGGFLSTWTSEDLREMIPDDEPRRHFVAELKPLPLAVYEEPLPVFTGWPDAPCGYLRFGSNSAYDIPARLAQERGWEYKSLEGQHFHMLVKPAEVTQALLDLTRRMGILKA